MILICWIPKAIKSSPSKANKKQPSCRKKSSTYYTLLVEDNLYLFKLGIKSEVFQPFYKKCSPKVHKDFEKVKNIILNWTESKNTFD